jgi:hypothetical protein
MNFSEFSTQIDRLRDCFGDKSFSEERTKMVWRSVQSLGSAWFTQVVDGMIATSKFAPLPSDFFEFASLERERLWQLEKHQSAEDAKEFMATYGTEEIQQVAGTIRDRINGGMSDSHFDSFQKLLRTAPTVENLCTYCSDNGVYLCTKKDKPDTLWAFRCHCHAGKADPRKQIPFYTGGHATKGYLYYEKR